MIAEGTPRTMGSKSRPIPTENTRIRNLPNPKPWTAPERNRQFVRRSSFGPREVAPGIRTAESFPFPDPREGGGRGFRISGGGGGRASREIRRAVCREGKQGVWVSFASARRGRTEVTKAREDPTEIAHRRARTRSRRLRIAGEGEAAWSNTRLACARSTLSRREAKSSLGSTLIICSFNQGSGTP